MSNTTETPVNSTYLSDEELRNFKERLLKEKESVLNRIEELETSAKDLESNLNDTDSSSAHHQGNIGSLEEQRETTYALLEAQREKLNKIKAALDRIGTGKYGICVVTGKPIAKERLEAMPYTIHSLQAKQGSGTSHGKERMSVSEATG